MANQEKYNAFANVVNQLLKKHEINQNQLAVRSGLKPDYINKIVRGNIQAPREEQQRAIAKAFGITEANLKELVKEEKKRLTNEQIIDQSIEQTEVNQDSLSKQELVVDRLLNLIWEYPLAGGDKRSWAVKESAILNNKLEYAEENIGLGVAVFSTQLAYEVFGTSASGRIDDCIEWAIEKIQKEKPYLLRTEFRDPITYQVTIKLDARHTMAFAVILARTLRKTNYVKHYLEFILGNQLEDDGWSPIYRETISEFVSVLYAVEFLSLCTEIQEIEESQRNRAREARNRGVTWLINNSNKKSALWRIGLFPPDWDSLIFTTYLIRRLAPLGSFDVDGWIPLLKKSLASLLDLTMNEETWSKTNEIVRFRVEARIASGVITALNSLELDPLEQDIVLEYLNKWKKKAVERVKKLSASELDLSTALFLVDSLIEKEELYDWKNRVIGVD